MATKRVKAGMNEWIRAAAKHGQVQDVGALPASTDTPIAAPVTPTEANAGAGMANVLTIPLASAGERMNRFIRAMAGRL